MLRSALLLLSGNAAASLLLFARNLVVARLIPVEDYGIAATFAIAMTVVEMATQFGLQQQIVQARQGDDPHFQAALQGFQLLRGAAGSAALLLLAGAMAEFLRIGELAWAYQLMALVPLLNALRHFDMHRLNRQMRFGPLVLTGTLPAALTLLAAWPLALWLGDFRVMLCLLLLQAGLGAVLSHLVAERRYRLAFDPAVMAGAFRFGWPLLVNALLLFGVFQGDKLIVGRELGMEALALFAMGMTLTLTPTLVMSKSLQGFFLPLLSRAAEERGPRFDGLAQAMLQAGLLNGALLVVAVLWLGAPVVLLLLGPKYAALVPLLTWFALLQGLRVFKTGPAVVALARGHAANAMIANGIRVAALPLAWWVVVAGGGIPALLAVGIAAEVLGFAAALALLRGRVRLSLRPSLPAIAAALLLILAAALSRGLPGLPPEIARAAGWAVPLLLLLQCIAAGDLRRALMRQLRLTERVA